MDLIKNRDNLFLFDTLSYSSEYPSLLLKAIKTDNKVLTKILIENEIRLNAVCKDGTNALLLLIAHNNIEFIKILCEKCPELVHEEGPKKHNPLSLACKLGYFDIVKYLLDIGCDVNHKTHNNSTPLIYASIYGYNDIIDILLENNANINIINDEGFTALIYASRYGYLYIVKKLLKNGATVNNVDVAGYSSLMYACKNGHLEIVELLLEKGANVNYKIGCFFNKTNAETLATNYNRKEIIKLLNSKKMENIKLDETSI